MDANGEGAIRSNSLKLKRKENMKELTSFITLVLSLIVAALLLPFQVIVMALQLTKTVLEIVIKTINNLISLIQDELNK